MTQNLKGLYVADVTTPAPANQGKAGESVPPTGVRKVRDIGTGAVITVDDRTFNPEWHEEII